MLGLRLCMMKRIVINRCKDLLKKRKYTEELTDQIAVFSNMPRISSLITPVFKTSSTSRW